MGYGQPYGHVPGPQGPTTPEERSTATLIHVLAIFFTWLSSLIFYIVKKDESRFLRHHAAEALNLSLSVLIVTISVSIVGCILSFVVIGIFLFFLLIPYSIAVMVYMIIAAMAANRGEWYEYPAWLRFPMVK